MQRFKSQSGRSMVEMLGTLAIIGVLSIGGIMGYSYGMDKYRANETINDINLRGIDLVRQVSMGQAPSLAEWETKSTAGYTFSNAQLSAEGDAYFTVSGVPKRVCEIIYEGIQNNQTTDVEVNEVTNGDASDCHKDDDNVMGFFFITNAGEGGKTPEDLCKNKTCPEGYSCTHGICMSDTIPGFSTSGQFCNKDSECGECRICRLTAGWGEVGGKPCGPVDNGTACSGGSCQDGFCISDRVCEDHTGCENGFYCNEENQCVKFEFDKVVLDEIGETIYISKDSRGFKNFSEDPNLFCELNGFKMMEQNHFETPEFHNALKKKIKSSARFYVFDTFCEFSDGKCGESYPTWFERYIICIDK